MINRKNERDGRLQFVTAITSVISFAAVAATCVIFVNLAEKSLRPSVNTVTVRVVTVTPTTLPTVTKTVTPAPDKSYPKVQPSPVATASKKTNPVVTSGGS